MLFILLLLRCAVMTHSYSPNIRSLELSQLINTRYQCINAACSPPTTVFASSMRDCQMTCLMNAQCRTISFYQSMNQCELFSDIPGEYGILLEEINFITMTAIDERQTSPRKYK